MEYTTIRGFRGGNLFYVQEERNLYVRKTTKAGLSYLVCYDTVQMKKSKQQDPHFEEYSARCTVDEGTGLCWRNNSCHRDHDNHELIFRDLQSLNAMKDHCHFLATKFPLSARRIPIKDIFLAEMAK